MNLSKEEEETYKIFRSAMLAVNISNIQELLNKAKAKAEQNWSILLAKYPQGKSGYDDAPATQK
jgi:hypothetical protein